MAGAKSRVIRENMMKVRPVLDEMKMREEEQARLKSIPPHLVMEKLLNLADFGSPMSID